MTRLCASRQGAQQVGWTRPLFQRWGRPMNLSGSILRCKFGWFIVWLFGRFLQKKDWKWIQFEVIWFIGVCFEWPNQQIGSAWWRNRDEFHHNFVAVCLLTSRDCLWLFVCLYNEIKGRNALDGHVIKSPRWDFVYFGRPGPEDCVGRS